ncbi:MAG: TIGR04283 family arsenosugar biosynthesis glycosyltransferase [Arenicellales bacterium]|nr:TIGR04283 family arsenosugar biosynthesis glycosyltransferase [Arenicellales bacterium]
MASEPLTIVVPVLNEVSRVDALISYLNTLPCKAIVVDGGSTDDTYVKLQTSVRSQVRVMSAPRGRATQMNVGARHADTPFLLFLHADTTLPHNGVMHVIAALQENKSVWGRFDVSFDKATPILRLVAWFMNWRSALTGICTGDQAIFMTAAAFTAVAGFDEIPLMEDIELSKKLKSLGKPIRLRTPVVTAARRWRSNGPIRTILVMWWVRLRYWFGAPPEALVKWYNDAR